MLAHAPDAAAIYAENDFLPFSYYSNLTRSDRFAQRVVSLGPHDYIQQPDEFKSRSEVLQAQGPSMASLVEMEHEKLASRSKGKEENSANAEVALSSETDENENHSCEDEELVISPQETNKPTGTGGQYVSSQPIETFAEQEDPYQSNQELMLFATNEERNADLNNADTDMRKKFSSLEDGEVRDEDDDFDE